MTKRILYLIYINIISKNYTDKIGSDKNQKMLAKRRLVKGSPLQTNAILKSNFAIFSNNDKSIDRLIKTVFLRHVKMW